MGNCPAKVGESISGAAKPTLTTYCLSNGTIATTKGILGTTLEILSLTFAGQFPTEVLPLFYAMMFGATLGGNGTLVGASSNIVAAGISELHGRRISFKRFLHYGIPVMMLQLIAAALYVIIRFLIWK